MATHVIPTVAEARAAANAWLIDHLSDRFAAGIPAYDPPREGWRISIWLAYPGLAPLGPVGELFVDAVSGEGQAHTPLAEMQTQALRMRVERTFAWEDTFERLLLWFERMQQRHYGMKLLTYTLINLRAFCVIQKLATS